MKMERLEAVHTHTHTGKFNGIERGGKNYSALLKIDKNKGCADCCNVLASNGITLIALVVTIIVLLILAGVTINLVVGENGIITRAREAQEKMEIAEIKEKMELSVFAESSDKLVNGGEITLKDGVDAIVRDGIVLEDNVDRTEEGSGSDILATDKGYVFEASKKQEENTVTIEYIGKTNNIIPRIEYSTNPKTPTSKVTIKIEAIERINGIKEIKVNGNSYKTYSGVAREVTENIEVTENGEYKIEVISNQDKKKEVTVTISNIDKEKPRGSHTLTPKEGTYAKQVTIKVTGEDNDGIASIMLPNNETKSSNTVEYTVTEKGSYTFVIKDNSGNTVNYVVEVSNIDNTAPRISHRINGRSIEIQAEDTESGVKEIQMIGGNTVQGNTAKFVVEETGTYTFKAVDNMGNESNSYQVKIELAPAYKEDLMYKEGTIKEGFVVTDSDNNEYVWVPVENPVAETEAEINIMVAAGKYPMAVKTSGTDSKGRQNYRGVLYDFSLDTTVSPNVVKPTPMGYSANTGYREPAYLTNSTTGDASSYNTVGITAASLQEEYNEMVERVARNKGFYIARYEASYNTTTSKAESKPNTAPMSAAGNRWWGMYAKLKGTVGNSISHMIWGSQWDQVMIFMKEVRNGSSFYLLNSTYMGNYSGGATNTGTNPAYSVKNIYDLAGNVYEWTMEAYNTYSRALHGAYYNYGGSLNPATDRNYNYPTLDYSYLGSRPTLY